MVSLPGPMAVTVQDQPMRMAEPRWVVLVLAVMPLRAVAQVAQADMPVRLVEPVVTVVVQLRLALVSALVVQALVRAQPVVMVAMLPRLRLALVPERHCQVQTLKAAIPVMLAA